MTWTSSCSRTKSAKSRAKRFLWAEVPSSVFRWAGGGIRSWELLFMGTISQRAYERLVNSRPSQARSLEYYQKIARGIFREIEVAAAFEALADVKCASVCFTNTSGATIGVRRGGGGVVISIPNLGGKIFDVTDNANELQVQNKDADVAATVQYECGGEATTP